MSCHLAYKDLCITFKRIIHSTLIFWSVYKHSSIFSFVFSDFNVIYFNIAMIADAGIILGAEKESSIDYITFFRFYSHLQDTSYPPTKAMETGKPYFATVDYCVFAAMLVISVLIGIYASLRGNKSPEDFLMGNRSFGALPVAMSLLTSIVSSISLLGFSGEVYLYGIEFSMFLGGIVFGILAAKHITLPVIYHLQLTSINEYIELRFKSRALRTLVLFLVSIQGLFYLGVCLYAPTIALSSVTPFTTNTYIYLLGGICTLYSSIGGIRAVVWTDVFQMVVMTLGMITIVTLGCLNLGGLVKMWSIAAEGERLNLFNFKFSIYERHSTYNLLCFGFFFFFSIYGVSQMNVQRMCAVRTIKDAKQILNYNIFGMFFIYFLVFTAGLMGYATYAKCDPYATGEIEKGEQILSYLVVDKLGHIWGLPGLFVATLVGGTLSSLSSTISSMVAQIWHDGFLKFKYFKNVSTSFATVINKVISLVVGCCLIGMAIFASQAENLAQFSLTITSASFGPIFGVFLLGMLFPRCTLKGAWSGLVLSYILASWIAVGGFIYGPKVIPLPLSTEMCELSLQVLDSNASKVLFNYTLENDFSFGNTSIESTQFLFPLARLYNISYTLYGVIGTAICVLVGMIVSCITGFEKLSNVSPEHITPFIRKFYWTKEENRDEYLSNKADTTTETPSPSDLFIKPNEF